MTLHKITINSALLACIILFGCSAPEFSHSKSFENALWKINDNAEFKYEAKKNQAPKNIYIEISHKKDYSYGNIFLFCDIDFPDGKTIHDTLQYILINPNYDWAGEGMGSKSLKFPYKQNVSFPEEGEYTFRICQAMRVGEDSILHGINKITLTIE